ncbi:RNA polymerase sigma factor [Streptomyces sp. RPA4-2]|uniref:RNA polymerase sigma factor n=1 Tax=Streptomyces sp. RPA4-2 TaxID=2721244 RepID=UPI002001DDCD|nr:RNA polymerase sigma factor [Streptomyces sp. RPA4-2]
MKQSMRARLRAGDPEAFRQLFQELGQAIYAHAYRATGDWSAAEDAVSLTFLEVWRLRERLEEGDESVRPWVYGIATNVLRNRGRSARKHQLTLARFPAPDTVPDFSDEVAERIDDGERLAAARAAVTKLRRGDRDVFMLCVWSDLSYTAASEALGIPVGTVRSRLSRARTRLLKLTEQELRRAKKRVEPPADFRQIQGDRTPAVRSIQEKAR